MSTVRTAAFIGIALVQFLGSCNGQTRSSAIHQPIAHPQKPVGGPFENGEFYRVGMPATIDATDTSAGWWQNGQKLLVTGTIYHLDGKTPAPGVLLYYYHTNVAGKYLHRPQEKRSMPPNPLGQTHGYIRGWVKSDEKGRYAIYTVRPGSYPSRDEPAHIHLTIKEPPIKNSYYIDDLVFDDDELLTPEKRNNRQNRGGSGMARLLSKDGLQIAEQDIVLGLNIPGYPEKTAVEHPSGLHIGEDQPSFTPYHAFGPDKGSRACPVCKYGRYHGILYFVGDHPDWEDMKKWLKFLERESTQRQKRLKAYLVYGNENNYSKATRQQELEAIGRELTIHQVALTFVPSLADKETEAYLNKIDAAAENTFIIYKNRNIVDKYIGLKPTSANFKRISSALDNTQGDYFHLPDPNQD